MDLPPEIIIKMCGNMNITELVSFIETNKKTHILCTNILEDKKQIIYNNFIQPYCVEIRGKRKTVIPAYFTNLIADLLLNGIVKEDLFYLINIKCVITNLPSECIEFIRLLSNGQLDPRIQNYIDDYLTYGKSNSRVTSIKPYGIFATMIASSIVHRNSH